MPSDPRRTGQFPHWGKHMNQAEKDKMIRYKVTPQSRERARRMRQRQVDNDNKVAAKINEVHSLIATGNFDDEPCDPVVVEKSLYDLHVLAHEQQNGQCSKVSPIKPYAFEGKAEAIKKIFNTDLEMLKKCQARAERPSGSNIGSSRFLNLVGDFITNLETKEKEELEKANQSNVDISIDTEGEETLSISEQQPSETDGGPKEVPVEDTSVSVVEKVQKDQINDVLPNGSNVKDDSGDSSGLKANKTVKHSKGDGVGVVTRARSQKILTPSTGNPPESGKKTDWSSDGGEPDAKKKKNVHVRVPVDDESLKVSRVEVILDNCKEGGEPPGMDGIEETKIESHTKNSAMEAVD